MKLLLFAAALLAVRFENIAPQAGLTQSIPNGGTSSKQFIIETTGSGVAMIDYDNDGLLDLFVASGQGGSSRLYHNEGKGRFTDVTTAMGIESSGWAQGVCAGDYDNDGFTDLFVTFWGANHLYRNVGGKRFEDVTARVGLKQDRTRYNTGCAFLDYDNDGRLDLFVANYLKFDPATTPKPGANPYCFYRDIPVNCGPRGLPFDRNILYHAKPDGTFEDVSVASGIATPDRNYGLGVLIGDFNNDGRIDIYVACDQTPSLLYINQGNGRFEEEGLLRGASLDSNGKALSGMGASAADYEGSGFASIFRSNFSDERETLYRAQNGRGEFEDATIAAGLARNTRFVGWGCGFFDFDNDGWKDLLIVNGHVFPEVDSLGLDIHYRDRAILYRNLGNGKFEDLSESAGPAILEKHSARGAAFGDIDNDGRIEVLVNNQNELPSLFKNTTPTSNHWLILKLTGTHANRSAIGAKVRISAGGRTQVDEVRSGGSYLSQSDLRLHFGLGSADKVDEARISWPGGRTKVLRNLSVDRVTNIVEDGEHALDAAALVRPVQPSRSARLLEAGLEEARARGPAAYYNASIRYRLNGGDWEAAITEARRAAVDGLPRLDATQELLSWLYVRHPSEGADLLTGLLGSLPSSIHDPLDAAFVRANLLSAPSLDPAIASAARERVRDTPIVMPAPPAKQAAVADLPELRAELQAILDQSFGLSTHRGKPLLVNFAEPWCAPCQREKPALDQLRSEGVKLIGISNQPELSALFEVVELPVTLVIAPDGHAIARLTGEQDAAHLRHALTQKP